MSQDKPPVIHNWGCWSWGPDHYLCALDHIYEIPKQYRYAEVFKEHAYSYTERDLNGEVTTVWALRTGRDSDDQNLERAIEQALASGLYK